MTPHKWPLQNQNLVKLLMDIFLHFNIAPCRHICERLLCRCNFYILLDLPTATVFNH